MKQVLSRFNAFFRRRHWLAAVLAAMSLAIGGLYIAVLAGGKPASTPVTTVASIVIPDINGPYSFKTNTDPDQTVVSDGQGHWLATFTNQARTVRLAGASRTFAEPQSTSSTVTHTTWVRVLAQPFNGTVNEAWLRKELADSSPDILAIAMQYIDKAAPLTSNGITIAGDASYGPVQDNKRKEGSDYNDYLGIPIKYGALTDAAEPAQLHAMDCSGYMRMVWGYRSGIALAAPDSPSSAEAIPRRAYQIQSIAPGIMLTPDNKSQVKNFSKLAIGDIVFFDANKNDGQQIDHNGMYMGLDSNGHYRFISSRKTVDGPTMGDIGGASILDGHGLYASAYRSDRRF